MPTCCEKAESIAAEEAISLNALLVNQLARLVKQRTPRVSYDEARRHALALLREGRKLGWKRPARRDEVHER